MILDTSKLLALARPLRADLIAYADRWHIQIPDQYRKAEINAKDEYQLKITGRAVELKLPDPDQDLISNVVLALSEVFFQCESYLDGLMRYSKWEALPKKKELEDSHYDFYNTMTKRVDFLQKVIDDQDVTDERMMLIIQRLKTFCDDVLRLDANGKDALQFLDDAPSWMKFWMKDRHGEQMTSQYAADHLALFKSELDRAENVYTRYLEQHQRAERQRELEAARAQEHANFEAMKVAFEDEITANKNQAREIEQQLAACIVTKEQMTRLKSNLLYIVTHRKLPDGVTPQNITEDLQFEDAAALQQFQHAMRNKVDPSNAWVFSSKPEDFVFVPETMHQIADKILQAIDKINTDNINHIQALSQQRSDLMVRNAELRTQITVEQLKQQHRIELLERDLAAIQHESRQARQEAQQEVQQRPARESQSKVGFFRRMRKRVLKIPRLVRRILLRRKALKAEINDDFAPIQPWPETPLHQGIADELRLRLPNLAPNALQVALRQEMAVALSLDSQAQAVNDFIQQRNETSKFPKAYKKLDSIEKILKDYYRYLKFFHFKRHDSHRAEFRNFVKWYAKKGKDAGDTAVEHRLLRMWTRLDPSAKSARRRVATAFSMLNSEKYTAPTFRS